MNKKEIEQHLQSAINEYSDCIALLDRKGKLIYLNKCGYELTGIKNINEARFFSQLELDQTTEKTFETIKSKIFKDKQFNGEGRLTNTLTNKKIDIQMQAFISPIDNNYISIILKDISAAKKLQHEIRDSEKNYEYLIKNAPLGLIIVKESKILFVNPALTNLLGYESGNELLGKHVFQFIHPDYHEAAKKRLKKLTSQEHRIVEIAEEKFIKKDGSIFDVVVMGQSIKYRGSTAIQGYIYDITDQKKAENLLRESELKYKTLIEGATDAIVCIDSNGMINVWNKSAEKMFGFNKNEIIGRPVHRMITPKDIRKKADERLAKFIKTGTGPAIGTTVELNGLHKSGIEFPIELSLSSIKTKEGWEATAFIRDISSRKKLEEELHHAQKMESIGRLTGGIAHDFNNVLSVIIGYSELMLNKINKDEQLYKYTSTILDSANFAASLTAQLLTFSRKQIINPVPVNVNQSIKNIQKILKRVIGEDIELKTFLQESLPVIKIDKSQLDQIILNLAVNAKDAMPEGGKLTIETSVKSVDNFYVKNHITGKTGDYVTISISDNGYGIEPDIKEKIFEPFFTTKKIGEGTGLGLSTVYGIVKQNNGFIWVYSEPGFGTTFKIYLPFISDKMETKEKTGTAKTSVIEEGTILVVEDEPNVRELIVEMLNMTNYTVIETGDVDEALGIMRKNGSDIDLLITDVIMPKLNGKSLAEQCKKINDKLLILYMSGYTENAIVHHGVLEEGLYFVQKPFTMQTLINKINEIFSK
jgi:PAS domain S-box-containing protein